MGKTLTPLKQALQSLALEAEAQCRLFNGPVQPAQLALDFIRQHQVIQGQPERTLTSQQEAVLDVLDSLLKEMSADSSLWTEKAVLSHSKWMAVRELAAASLTAFDSPPLIRAG